VGVGVLPAAAAPGTSRQQREWQLRGWGQLLWPRRWPVTRCRALRRTTHVPVCPPVPMGYPARPGHTPRLLVFTAVVAAGAAAEQAVGQPRLSRAKMEEFALAFAGLDSDGDGSVVQWEAAVGLRALGEAAPVAAAAAQEQEQRQHDPPLSTPRSVDRYTCAPSIEPADFIDCVAGRARAALAAGRGDGDGVVDERRRALSFEAALASFIGGTDDDLPPWLAEEESCDAVVESHRASCEQLLAEGTCLLSCGHHWRTYTDDVAAQLMAWQGVRGRGGADTEKTGGANNVEEQEAAGVPASSALANRHRRRAQVVSPPMRRNNVTILISSDWHLEPWYDVTGSGAVNRDTRISRFAAADATLSTMGQCRRGSGAGATIDRCVHTHMQQGDMRGNALVHARAVCCSLPC
jgi:hypothetical protein